MKKVYSVLGMRSQLSILLALCFTLAGYSQITPLFSGIPVSDTGTSNQLGSSNSTNNIASDSQGNLFVLFWGDKGIRVSRSLDRGQSFEKSVAIDTNTSVGEIIVGANDAVYVAYSRNGYILFSRSTDHGASFSVPDTVAPVSVPALHMATQDSLVFVLGQQGDTLYRNANYGVGEWEAIDLPSSYAYSNVMINPLGTEVWVVADNPTLFLFSSSDFGKTFSPVTITPSGSIFYSAYTLSASSEGVFAFISGSGTAAAKINLETGDLTNLSFRNNTSNEGRSLLTDAFGNIIDSYIDGDSVYFSTSQDQALTFGDTVTVAKSTSHNLCKNPFYKDMAICYLGDDGKIYANVYENIFPNQAYDLHFSLETSSSVNLSWNKGDGDARVVFIKDTVAGKPAPEDNMTYTANAEFGAGDQLGTSGWYCVYNGTDSLVTITGLTNGTSYRVAVFEYTGSAGSEEFIKSEGTMNPIGFTMPIDLSGVGVDVAMGELTGTNLQMEFSLNSTDGLDGDWYDCQDPKTEQIDFGIGGFTVWVRDSSATTVPSMVAEIAPQVELTSGVTVDLVTGTVSGLDNNEHYRLNGGDWSTTTTGVSFIEGLVEVYIPASVSAVASTIEIVDTITESELALAKVHKAALDNDASGITAADLVATGATDVDESKLAEYQAAIADASSIADLAALQAIIDEVNNPSSINELSKIDIHVYPNPVEEYLYIDLPPGLNANIYLFDITGKSLQVKMASQNIMDLKDLPLGVYYLRVNESVKKIIKQ